MQSHHPRESIPGYVLGALDADEALRVRDHLAVCQACRAEAESFHAVVSMLPYSAPRHDPPAHVRNQLFARVAASREPRLNAPWPAAEPARAPQPVRRTTRTMLASLAAAASLVLALGLGYVALDTRAQLARLSAELGESRRAADELRALLGQDDQIVGFIASPQTVSQQIPATQRAPGASALMYMQPGHNQVVLVVHGLPRLQPGKVYRLWLASETELVPVTAAVFRDSGVTQFHGFAPRPMETYGQVMVTVEDAGSAPSPSDEVLLETSL